MDGVFAVAMNVCLNSLAADRTQARSMIITRYGIVATEQTVASQVGATILAQGGNAVVYVKCKDTNLNGDASIFTSAGRTYPLLLKSKSHSQLRWVRFYDPEPILAQMRAADAAPATTPDPDPIAPSPGTKLNAAYSINGPNVAWKPHRAFDDGTHVWIEMPQMSSPVRPILLGDDRSQLNYRVRGQYFETDSLFSKATLIADNQKVFIQRSGQ